MQESENGLLSFPFTVRNQVTTALSTLEALTELHDELLTFQRDFYTKGDLPRGGYYVETDGDLGRAREMTELLRRHGVIVKQYGEKTPTGYWISNQSTNHRFIESLFEPLTSFEDSLFYDVSTWTLPHAFNLPYRKMARPPADGFMPLGGTGEPAIDRTRAGYAYLLPWDDYYAARAAYYLLDHGVRLKVSSLPLTDAAGKTYARGAVLIPLQNQEDLLDEDIHQLVREAEDLARVDIEALDSGYNPDSPDLGSRAAFETIRKPTVALLVEGGVNPYDAGEVWHLLDQRFDIPVTKLPLQAVGRADLSRYNTIIMVDGNYGDLGSAGTGALQRWLGPDRVLITQKRAATWAAANNLAKVRVRAIKEDTSTLRLPYSRIDRDRGGRVLGGSIFQTEADLTSPLLYGFKRENVPVFRRGTLLFEPTKNKYATPLTYTDKPLLSGYVHPDFIPQLEGSAALLVSGANGGRTICFADNPNFRAFWFGTNRLFLNAIFFGHTIERGGVE